MKIRWAWWVAGCFIVGAQSISMADPAASSDANSYLQQLQIRLEHAAQRANQPDPQGSSVVGLRGSAQEPASQQLYWKGVRGPAPISVDEIKLFRSAVEQARAGQHAQAVTALQDFQKKYPQSAFAPDVQKTLQLLSAAPTVPTEKS